MSQVWKQSQTQGSELLLLLAMADYADDCGVCYPSQSALARKARISERTVIRLLQKLEKLGEIYKEAGAGMIIKTAQGERKTNRYCIKSSGDNLSSEQQSSGDKSGTSSGDIAMSHSTSVQPVKVRIVPPKVSAQSNPLPGSSAKKSFTFLLPFAFEPKKIRPPEDPFDEDGWTVQLREAARLEYPQAHLPKKFSDLPSDVRDEVVVRWKKMGAG